MGGWGQGRAPRACVDPQPQESGSEAPLPQPGTPQEGALPPQCSSVRRLTSVCHGAEPAAPLHFSKGQCCKSREKWQVDGMGKGGVGGQGGQAAGSDCKEKAMSPVAHCRLRARKLLSPGSPFCARQRHRASWERSEGREQAACMSSEDGHLRVLLDKARFPSRFHHT